MSEERILSAESLSASRTFTRAHWGRITKRRIILTLSALSLTTAAIFSYRSFVLTDSVMTLIFMGLMFDRLCCILLSFSSNLITSKGIFKNRFPLGLRRWELNAAKLNGLLLLGFGLSIMYLCLVGDYNLDVIDLHQGFGLLILAALAYLVSGYLLHRSGIRSINSRSEAASIRAEVLPITVVLLGSAALYLTNGRFIDPFLSIVLSIFISINAVQVMHQAYVTLRATKDKNHTYLRLRDEIVDKFGGELLSAQLQVREHGQRFGRVKVSFPVREKTRRHEIQAQIEQYLLDDFDMDKAFIHLRFTSI